MHRVYYHKGPEPRKIAEEDWVQEINYKKNGNTNRPYYQYHRLDGPARIRYHPDGSIAWEAWLVNGEFHRDDGPGHIVYKHSTYIGSEGHEYEWYYDNEDYTFEEWLHIVPLPPEQKVELKLMYG